MTLASVVPLFRCLNCDERSEDPNWFCVACMETTRSWGKVEWREFETKINARRAEEAWRAIEEKWDR